MAAVVGVDARGAETAENIRSNPMVQQRLAMTKRQFGDVADRNAVGDIEVTRLFCRHLRRGAGNLVGGLARDWHDDYFRVADQPGPAPFLDTSASPREFLACV
jgi:hypothetical protein